MSEQPEFILDLMSADDPELANLVSLPVVAHYWKVEEEYARRRLREDGVHLIKIDHPLMVRWHDVLEFEKAHTIILGRKSERQAKEKEAMATP
jgi:hypothetical protein